jgi:imidazolonepropionase-like amidohydrolase
VNPDAHLVISFSTDALHINREPTSASGAVALLEQEMKSPRGAFAEAARGRRLVMLDARSRDEIQRAVDFATRHGLRGAITRAHRAGELLREVQASGLGVIVGPFRPGASRESLESVVALGEVRVPLAFALDAPGEHPDSLRFGAALCVRAGLDPDVAWRALTSDGARVAGVGESIGRLDRGLAADFVLWSGDPLDLSSSVVEVYVDGVRAFGGAK